MATGTRRGTLMYCLGILEKERQIISKDYLGREAVKGKEELFDVKSAMIADLRELIRACDSEPVRIAMANWQQLILDGERPNMADLDAYVKEGQK